MKRSMSSKERVLTAFSRQEPDRVPLDYSANPGIDGRLKAHYGLSRDDGEGLRRALGIDFRHVGAPYVGPALHPQVEGVSVDMWGIHRRWVKHDTGGYWDYCDFPLKDATLETIASWPMPSPDDCCYDDVAARCADMGEFCVVTGGAGLPDVINSTGMIRTMERVLMDLILHEEAGLTYIDRRIDILLEVTRRTLEAARGGIEVLALGEDLGTQRGPTLSLDLFRREIRPASSALSI